MINGNELLLKQLQLKYNMFCESFYKNDIESIIISIKEYLYEVFPAREKLGIKQESDIEFKAMKKLYNLFKHYCDFNALIQTHQLISNKSYPYQYPYRYGKSGIRFSDFTEVYESTNYDARKKENDKNLCNKILRNKEPNLIINKLHNDTVSKLAII